MDKPKQMIVVRRDLKMRKGKIAAQAGHACVNAVLAALVQEGRLGQVQAAGTEITLCPSDRLQHRSVNGLHGALRKCAYMWILKRRCLQSTGRCGKPGCCPR